MTFNGMPDPTFDDFVNEQIYRAVLLLQTAVDDHPWSRRMTRADSEAVATISKKLFDIGNALYLANQDFKNKYFKDDTGSGE